MSGVQVKRDGEVKETFDSGDLVTDQNDAFEYVLKHQGQSVDWAIRYEGWEITEAPAPAAAALDAYLFSLRKIRSLKNAASIRAGKAETERQAALAAGVTETDLRHFEREIGKGNL